MTKLGPEYVGKLPPGAADVLQKTLLGYQQSAKLGIVKGVEILPGPGCSVAERQVGTIYQVDQVPSLPFNGCSRAPCCGCCYTAVVES